MPQGRSLKAGVALLLAATLGPLATPASSAPPAPPETPREGVHEVVWVEGGEAQKVAGVVGTAATIAETPLAVSAIGATLLAAQDTRSLSDALANVAGVNVQPGNGVHDFFVMRGVDSLTGGLVVSDGVPEPEASFYHAYNLDRVEVVRGPAGFRWGSGATAGAVALLHKRPRRGQSFFTLGGDYASFDTWRGTADVGVANDEIGLRVNLLREGSDGFRDGHRSDVRAANPVVDWQQGDTSVTASVELARDRHHPDAGIPVAGSNTSALNDIPRTRSYESPYDASQQDTARLRLELATKLGEATDLRVLGYYTSLDWDSQGTLLNGVFPDAAGRASVARALVLLDDRQSILGSRIELSTHFGDPARPRHRLLAGFELQRQRDDFALDFGLLPAIDRDAPRETASGPPFVLPGFGSAANVRALIAAPYALDRVDLGDGLEAWLGARIDHIDYQDDANAIDRNDTELSPLFGLTYRASASATLYANLGRGFALPSSRVTGPREPEESRALEVGVKTSFSDGKFELQLALYQLARRDIAIPDANGVTASDGDQRAQGFELELRGRPLPRTQMLVSFALSDVELSDFRELVRIGAGPTDFAVLDRSGNRAPFAPVHLGRLWLSYDLGGGLDLGAGMRVVGTQNIAPDAAFQIEGYALIDAALAYGCGDLGFALHGRNLGDARYAGRGFGNASVIPGEGRALRASMSWSR